MAQEKFWIILKREDNWPMRPLGWTPARFRTKEEAQQCAKYMSQKFGDCFFVLEVVEGWKRGSKGSVPVNLKGENICQKNKESVKQKIIRDLKKVLNIL